MIVPGLTFKIVNKILKRKLLLVTENDQEKKYFNRMNKFFELRVQKIVKEYINI